MKTQTAVLFLLALAICGSIAAAYYYTAILNPQTPSPTVTQSPSTSPSNSAYPSPTPLSYTPQTVAPSSASPTPIPTISPTASPFSLPWTITNITRAETSTSLTSGSTYGFGKTYSPKNANDVFLVVGFWLRATNEADILNVQEISVLVDNAYSFSPVGEGLGLGSTSGGAAGDLMVGNITRGWEGSLAFKGFTSHLAMIDLDPPNSVSYSTYIEEGVSPPFRFVYVLPKTYVDGYHSLELEIAGATEGVEFTINSQGGLTP